MNEAKALRKSDEEEMLKELDQFISRICEEFKLEPKFQAADRNQMLKLTGKAAHNLVRPAAPFSALAVGFLVGSGQLEDFSKAHQIVSEFIDKYLAELNG